MEMYINLNSLIFNRLKKIPTIVGIFLFKICLKALVCKNNYIYICAIDK